MLAGNGTAPGLRGLDATTGVQVQAKGADSVALALAKGLALVVAAGFTPTAVALHPNDWTDAIGPLITAGGTLSGLARRAGRQVGVGAGGDRLRRRVGPAGGLAYAPQTCSSAKAIPTT